MSFVPANRNSSVVASLSLSLSFFSFSLLRYTSHRIGRIPCKRLCATLVEPALALLLYRLAVFRRLADRQRRCSLHRNRSVLQRTTTSVLQRLLFPPLGFSSPLSFVTRTARRHDIASFHLQPHPLIPPVGVACNSSVPRKKIDVHRLCRLVATLFFPRPLVKPSE